MMDLIRTFNPVVIYYFGKLRIELQTLNYYVFEGEVGMTSLQVNCSLAEVNASVFIAVF